MMNPARWTAKRYLALFACAVGFGAASVAQATTSNLTVTGNFDFQVTGNTVVLTLNRVDNITVPPRISGELWLELWAFPVPFSGLGQANYQQNGYRLASYPLNRIAPGYYLYAINSGPIPYHPPSPGTYHIT